MIAFRCGKCTWWDSQHPRLATAPAFDGIAKPGLCRKHKPGAVSVDGFFFGVQVIMDAEDFCGEFREEKTV
jgi:hypothetical protein